MLNNIAVKKIVVWLLAVCVFLLVLGIGGLVGLQITKRQFEAEAQNIASVLRSGVSVADGVVTSLVASNYTHADQLQLHSHFSDVLGNYKYISALGQIEQIPHDQIETFSARFSGIESSVDSPWHFDRSGDVATSIRTEQQASYLPLTAFKSRFSSDKESYTDLAGFDLGAFTSRRAGHFANSSEHTIITEMPPGWNRPGELLLFRTELKNANELQGYMLELDLEEMASSGGVEIANYSIRLSMFSEQGEFASESVSEELYHQIAVSNTDLYFDKWVGDNKWLNSFSLGEKTLVLDIGGPTGLSANLVVILCLIGAFLSLIFITIVELVRKKRHALRLQTIESDKLYRSRYRATVTLASIDDAVITTDVHDKILYANDAAQALLGCDEVFLQGCDVDSIVVHAEEDGNLVLTATDGSRRIISKKQSPLKDLNGELTGHVLVLRDISVEHSLTQELKYKVNRDSLTGLANRHYFENQLTDLISAPEITGIENGHVLCVIDLDRFKEVNDTCGHGAGDELLVKVAESLCMNVRDNDLVARLGGDEFGIVLRNCSRSSADQVTGRIENFFQKFFFEYEGHIFPVRCSIGFVYFMPDTDDIGEVIKSADAACFDAKHLGRNSVCERLVGDSNKHIDEVSKWLPRLQDALAADNFELFTRPVISLRDGSIVSHEVVLRLSENGVLTSSGAFMKSAIRYELAESIDRWVVSDTLNRMVSLKPEFAEDKFTINLTSQSIDSEQFIDFLKEEIELSGIDVARLCFDVKESDLLREPANSEEFCRALRGMGAEVALDDFGAGLTSFELLKSIPVTAIKIDGSLIADLNSYELNEKSANVDHAMVRSIHSFASSMGLTTIAQQVDSAGCLEILSAIEVDCAQGPAAAEAVRFDTLCSTPLSDLSGSSGSKAA